MVTLKREVITDPMQIAPVTEQVRSVLPWWRRLLFGLMLSGCATEYPEHTLVDAAREVARANCSRWITCGSTDEQWQECVNDVLWNFCGTDGIVCSSEYPDWKFEEVEACTEFFLSVPCDVYVKPCYI